MWCMINNDATGDCVDWLKSFSSIPGVSHDGHNTVYPHIPPNEFNGTAMNVPGDLSGNELMFMVGSFLASNEYRYLIAERSQFEYLYLTPEWRLWCTNYSSIDQLLFESDKQQLNINEDKTQSECHELIWHKFLIESGE